MTVHVHGKVLDENYTRALLTRTDIPLRDVVALDKVQKRVALDDRDLKRLRERGLVEGKRPNIRVSALIAGATGTELQYVESRVDDAHYKRLVLDLITQFGPKSPADIQRLLIPKLPKMLSETQKKRKVSNLIQQMCRIDETIENIGGKGIGARWSARRKRSE